MIGYIKGELVYAGTESILIDNQGIGYEIQVPGTVLDKLPALGEEVKIYTYLHVREDVMQLFGFWHQEDLEIFKLLITVNGIGPKGALGILSAISPDDLRFAILADDAKAIAKAPGIGAKTAAKMILELKDKMKLEDAFEIKLEHQKENEVSGETVTGIRNEAVQALTALGYSNTEALKAVRNVKIEDNMDVETVLKLSLKHISF